ncbi:MAG: hypothetical protein QM817_13085 [Archangium sp.]
MLFRVALVAAVCFVVSGCCVLWYCGPPLAGSACSGTMACPTGWFCDTTYTDAGFCTKSCRSSDSTGLTDCMISGDQFEGVCAPAAGDAGSLECFPPCELDGGGFPCPTGMACLVFDAGQGAAFGAGVCR